MRQQKPPKVGQTQHKWEKTTKQIMNRSKQTEKITTMASFLPVRRHTVCPSTRKNPCRSDVPTISGRIQYCCAFLLLWLCLFFNLPL